MGMTNREVMEMRMLASLYELEGREIAYRYSNLMLCKICNGIGPDAFPEFLRDIITGLHPTIAPAAFIHDIEYYESDRSRKRFEEANERFKKNGYRCAEKHYSWFNPLRYTVKRSVRLYYGALTLFGWDAWLRSADEREKHGGRCDDEY